MRKWLDKTTALVLCGALVLVACGGDDDEAAPVEPEPEPVAELTPEIVGLIRHAGFYFYEYLLRCAESPVRRRCRGKAADR